MSPHQFAREACDGYQPNGSCCCIRYSDDLTRAASYHHTTCLLANNVRCAHFEECIIPKATWNGKEADAAKRTSDRMEAVRAYKHLHAVNLSPSRQCPSCGLSIPPRKRLCDACRKKARLASTRAAVSKLRSDVSS